MIAHNEVTRQHRYWKLKGKNPPTFNTASGDGGPIIIHVLLVPTPPSDYILAKPKSEAVGVPRQVTPVPMYGYHHSVQIIDPRPNVDFADEVNKEYGIIKFDTATPGSWPVACTCLERVGEGLGDICMRPRCDGVPPTS